MGSIEEPITSTSTSSSTSTSIPPAQSNANSNSTTTPSSSQPHHLTIGVLALQGAFEEHIQLLRQATSPSLSPLSSSPSKSSPTPSSPLQSHTFSFPQIRTPLQLSQCDALIIPGGESTAISLVAERSGMLEPLRDFVKLHRKPTWGTCAGLILLAESANRTKRTGQELIGGLDVRVNRNHFGRQVESFEAVLELGFLASTAIGDEGRRVEGEGEEGKKEGKEETKFKAIFIRAPIVESLLAPTRGIQEAEASKEDTIVAAPSKTPMKPATPVEVLGRLPPHKHIKRHEEAAADRVGNKGGKKEEEEVVDDTGDIVAVRQGNCFGTSFHPELTGDERVHAWWLGEVVKAVDAARS